DVVVGGDGLGVAVDHHRLVAGLAQGLDGVDAGGVELDPLADPVRTRPEHHHPAAAGGRDLGLLLVGRVVVGGGGLELAGAGVGRAVTRAAPHARAAGAALARGGPDGRGQLGVGEAVTLGPPEQAPAEVVDGGGRGQLGPDLGDAGDPVHEPGVDVGGGGHLV